MVVLTACGSGQPDNREEAQAICVDPVSQNRVDDDYCDEDDDDYHSGYGYFFFMPGQLIPGMGQSAKHGAKTQPPNTKSTFGGFNKTGGQYTKPAPKVDTNTKSNSNSGSVKSGSTSGGSKSSSGSSGGSRSGGSSSSGGSVRSGR